MSLDNLKAIKNGLYISGKAGHTVIISLEIIPRRDKTISEFQNEEIINRMFYYLFQKNTSRYTLTFVKNSSRKRKLYLSIYFTSNDLKDIAENSKQTLNRLSDLLYEFGLGFKIQDSKKKLQELKERVPISIAKSWKNLYKIQTKTSHYYLSLAKFHYLNEVDPQAFFSLFKDFLSYIPFGKINIDILNKNDISKDGFQQFTELSILFIFENKEIKLVKESYLKTLELMKLLTNTKQKIKRYEFYFIDDNELQENFGKIILQQGWKFFKSDYTELLNYHFFFNQKNLK